MELGTLSGRVLEYLLLIHQGLTGICANSLRIRVIRVNYLAQQNTNTRKQSGRYLMCDPILLSAPIPMRSDEMPPTFAAL